MLVHGCGFQVLLSFVCFLRSSSWKVSKVPGIPFFLCGFLQKEAPEDKCICRSSWSNSPSAQKSISHSSADMSTSYQYCLHVWRLEIVRMVPFLELVSLKRLILLFVISMPCVHVCVSCMCISRAWRQRAALELELQGVGNCSAWMLRTNSAPQQEQQAPVTTETSL